MRSHIFCYKIFISANDNFCFHRPSSKFHIFFIYFHKVILLPQLCFSFPQSLFTSNSFHHLQLFFNFANFYLPSTFCFSSRNLFSSSNSFLLLIFFCMQFYFTTDWWKRWSREMVELNLTLWWLNLYAFNSWCWYEKN